MRVRLPPLSLSFPPVSQSSFYVNPIVFHPSFYGLIRNPEHFSYFGSEANVCNMDMDHMVPSADAARRQTARQLGVQF